MSEPIKVFWIEPTERVVARIQRKGADQVEETAFESRAEADNHVQAAWKSGTADWTALQPVYHAPSRPELGTFPISEAPPGAMWDADWMPAAWPRGEDGIYLIVRLPNRWDWTVDDRASNCTLKEDHVHRCWCRHGDPRTGNVHVDKRGLTCSAGAGSIQGGNWHGFLHDGFLKEC